jgi:hypothetical protein
MEIVIFFMSLRPGQRDVGLGIYLGHIMEEVRMFCRSSGADRAFFRRSLNTRPVSETRHTKVYVLSACMGTDVLQHLVPLMFELGADPRVNLMTPPSTMTIISLAIYHRNLEWVRLCISHGADLEPTRGETPLQLAINGRRKDIALLIHEELAKKRLIAFFVCLTRENSLLEELRVHWGADESMTDILLEEFERQRLESREELEDQFPRERGSDEEGDQYSSD